MTASRKSGTRRHRTDDHAGGEIGRIIGERGETGKGPLLIITAGIHGNEKSGIEASQRVFAFLDRENTPLFGRVVAIAGNLNALTREVRFVDRDLNRMWLPDRIIDLPQNSRSVDCIEETEQRQMLDVVESEVAGHHGPVILLDLHSTSADSPPFSIISDTLQNRRVAFALALPVVLGLEEVINGTIQDYYGERGYVTAAIEGGQHDDPTTVDRIESALWITIVTSGIADGDRVPRLEAHRKLLRDAAQGLPSVVEVVHRHGRASQDGFRMVDGFKNFTPIRSGQLVARDSNGEIRAQADGMLLLPSYQVSDNDGYFIGSRVRRFWLRLSASMRRLRLGHLAHWLPGVKRHPHDDRSLLVDPKVARWLTLKIFHLLGFRRSPREDGYFVFRHRPEGTASFPRR
jgi:succinylglutamate desuccinylase